MPSITHTTVWDLPLWAWRQYAAFHDEYVRQQQKGAAE